MSIAEFGNFLGPDTLIIFLIILIFFGAKRLPEFWRGFGQALDEFSDPSKQRLERPPLNFVEWTAIAIVLAMLLTAFLILFAQ